MSGLVEWLKEHDLYHLGGAFFLLIVCFCAWAAWHREAVPSAQGRDVSELRLVDPGGTVRRVGDLAGRVVVLDFWATWCPPCQMSLPEVAALQSRQGDAYAVLPVSLDRGGFEDVRPFLNRHPQWGLFTVVPVDSASLADQVGEIQAIPTTLIVDASGRVVRSLVGYSPGRLERELREVLNAPAPAGRPRPSQGSGALRGRDSLFGLSARDFLVCYPALMALLLGAGRLLRRAVVDLGSRPPPRVPDLYGVAYLRGRARGVLETALTRLSVLGLLDVHLGARAIPSGMELDPMEAALLHQGRFQTAAEMERAFKAREASRLSSYERILQAEALIPDATQVAKCNWIRGICLLAALGLGGPSVVGAYVLGQNGFFSLLSLEVCILVMLAIHLLRPPLATSLGRALLRQVAGEVRHPLTKARESSSSLEGPVPLSLAVAAIGRGALAGTPFTDLANHLRPPRNHG